MLCVVEENSFPFGLRRSELDLQATALQAVFLESKTAATRDWAQVRTPDRIHPAAN